MAGKRDMAVVAVISDLTSNQAAEITRDILKAKRKYAPNGRGTVASGYTSSVGNMLQQNNSRKRIGGA